jgi:hypothetical protein
MPPWIKSLALMALMAGLALPRAAAESPAGDVKAPAVTPVSSGADASSDRGATWAVDPREPGPNLPPVGRSLFDFLVADDVDGEPGYRIPFPFAALRDELAQRLHASPQREPFRQVLIPLGRSLQRTAAAPEFAHYPRAVLAVVGEPAPEPGTSGILLKDRLYFGYMEKTGVVEVISYNEAAGRFEFQVVKDFREGAEPRVFYANRAVCTACHQNAAPLFSRPLWDETNANDRIATLLEGQGRDFYGIPVDIGIDVPNGIDDATGRANLIPAIQVLWQRACGVEPDGPEARRCRARALRFALQYRLAGHLHFIRPSEPEWQGLAAAVKGAWRQQWPGGLAISSPDIPNRQPLGEDVTATGAPDHLYEQLHVPTSLDPLLPRPPLETWTAEDGPQRLITGIAGFFADVDVERLDRALYERAVASGSGHRQYDAPCVLTTKRRDDGSIRLGFTCGDTASPAKTAFAMRGRIYLDGMQVVRGTVDHLTSPEGATLIDLQVSGGILVAAPEGSRLALRLARGALHARGGDGNAIEGLEVAWRRPGTTAFDMAQGVEARAVLTIVEDFPALATLLSALADGGESGDALSARPFRRATVLDALNAGLGMGALRTCCVDAAGLPAAAVDDHPDDAVLRRAAAQGVAEAEQGFYRYCALCHRTNERSPPNFLHGTPGEVRDHLAQCAERLYVRLAMWERPGHARSKTPMPPVPALAELGVNPSAWPESPELAGLQRYVADLLRSQTGRDPVLEELEARGYENLRTCLADPG